MRTKGIKLEGSDSAILGYVMMIIIVVDRIIWLAISKNQFLSINIRLAPIVIICISIFIDTKMFRTNFLKTSPLNRLHSLYNRSNKLCRIKIKVPKEIKNPVQK